MIEDVTADAERAAVQAFFSEHFDNIAPNAVPMADVDYLYAPLILRYVDQATGELLGAGLSNRAAVAVASATAQQMMGSDPLGYAKVLDAHSELDLLAVRRDVRGRGIGAQLIDDMAQRLRARGVRAWFGNVTPNLDVEGLSRFYARNGFRVGALDAPIPPLLGKDWTMPATEAAAFYFWRRL
ncbi:GNAT family N-acetyltransferase [Modestobacter sp. VKM Ac-2978]|uniref:GNAT family N-acetyltransferase n=1 Tax=Modestobacter sp. VKM Ac-2978 TaxID=3004132 RepID=UPI0022AAA331|nr:GNAT family N-acetyltransferase [Modestobacter sp. VKM Ac-2978]MCZ2850004.1 GNAT family N-acetyltransferase [Modestobacter sp. VKM Ac-2978]